MRIVVSDTSPLVALEQLGLLHILPALFGEVLIPQAVWDELAVQNETPGRRMLFDLAWVRVLPVPKLHTEVSFDQRIGAGESDAIRLAIALDAALIIVDDLVPRRIAQGYGLDVVGTLGLLRLAKEMKILDSIAPYIYRLRDEFRFRLDDVLILRVLREAGEV